MTMSARVNESPTRNIRDFKLSLSCTEQVEPHFKQYFKPYLQSDSLQYALLSQESTRSANTPAVAHHPTVSEGLCRNSSAIVIPESAFCMAYAVNSCCNRWSADCQETRITISTTTCPHRSIIHHVIKSSNDYFLIHKFLQCCKNAGKQVGSRFEHQEAAIWCTSADCSGFDPQSWSFFLLKEAKYLQTAFLPVILCPSCVSSSKPPVVDLIMHPASRTSA